MTQRLQDSTGAAVAVRLEHTRGTGSYTVQLAEGPTAGRADFVDSPTVDRERIFFHTEVDPDLRGRGVAGLLVRAALADSLRRGITVVPVCPLFAAHLKKHGVEHVADGGRFRRPGPADLALASAAARERARPTGEGEGRAFPDS